MARIPTPSDIAQRNYKVVTTLADHDLPTREIAYGRYEGAIKMLDRIASETGVLAGSVRGRDKEAIQGIYHALRELHVKLTQGRTDLARHMGIDVVNQIKVRQLVDAIDEPRDIREKILKGGPE